MKKKPALIAAFLTTLVVAGLMFAVAGSAFFTSPVSAASASDVPTEAIVAAAGSAVAKADANTAQLQAQVQQLQARINEYQQREQQWQQRLDQSQQQASQAEQQLQQVSGQLQQYSQLVGALQQMGVITIDANGQVYVSRGLRHTDNN